MSPVKDIIKNWPKLNIEDILSFFVVSKEKGLTAAEVTRRAQKIGKNSDPTVHDASSKYFKSSVIRDSKRQTVYSSNLVLGDIVILEKNNLVPADIRLIEVDNLTVNQQAVTGVAALSFKNTLTQIHDENDSNKIKNMAYSGSLVIAGSGKGIVVAIGPNTQIAKSLSGVKQKKPSFSNRRKINKLHELSINVQNHNILSSLSLLDTVVFNIDLSTDLSKELVRSTAVAMGKNIILVTSSNEFKKLYADIPGIVKIEKRSFDDKSNKSLLESDHPILALIGVNQQDILRYVNLLKLKHRHTLWVDSGRDDQLVNGAVVSVVVADTAKPVSIKSADIVIPSSSDSRYFIKQIQKILT